MNSILNKYKIQVKSDINCSISNDINNNLDNYNKNTSLIISDNYSNNNYNNTNKLSKLDSDMQSRLYNKDTINSVIIPENFYYRDKAINSNTIKYSNSNYSLLNSSKYNNINKSSMFNDNKIKNKPILKSNKNYNMNYYTKRNLYNTCKSTSRNNNYKSYKSYLSFDKNYLNKYLTLKKKNFKNDINLNYDRVKKNKSSVRYLDNDKNNVYKQSLMKNSNKSKSQEQLFRLNKSLNCNTNMNNNDNNIINKLNIKSEDINNLRDYSDSTLSDKYTDKEKDNVDYSNLSNKDKFIRRFKIEFFKLNIKTNSSIEEKYLKYYNDSSKNFIDNINNNYNIDKELFCYISNGFEDILQELKKHNINISELNTCEYHPLYKVIYFDKYNEKHNKNNKLVDFSKENVVDQLNCDNNFNINFQNYTRNNQLNAFNTNKKSKNNIAYLHLFKPTIVYITIDDNKNYNNKEKAIFYLTPAELDCNIYIENYKILINKIKNNNNKLQIKNNNIELDLLNIESIIKQDQDTCYINYYLEDKYQIIQYKISFINNDEIYIKSLIDIYNSIKTTLNQNILLYKNVSIKNNTANFYNKLIH